MAERVDELRYRARARQLPLNQAAEEREWDRDEQPEGDVAHGSCARSTESVRGEQATEGHERGDTGVREQAVDVAPDLTRARDLRDDLACDERDQADGDEVDHCGGGVVQVRVRADQQRIRGAGGAARRGVPE